MQLGSRFGELGFDSLMYAELSSALETAGIALPDSVDVTTLGTVAELQELLVRGPAAAARELAAKRGARRRRRDPRARGRLGGGQARARLGAARCSTSRCCETKVKGAAHIPQHTSFIVAANHASHLDMGAIKVALGDAGRDLTSLAAADYFFRNRYRRAYFKHFTNLVPMERSGSIRKSMDTAESVLRRGRSMVVFPEGTRSVSGEMAEFLPSLGYLAMRAEVGVLPAHVGGSFEALPKGTAVPRARELTVSFGPFLSREWLRVADRRACRRRRPGGWSRRSRSGSSRTCATAWRRRWTPTRRARPGTARRWGPSRCATVARRRVLRSVP